MIKTIHGNSLEELKKFPDNYFHSVVTDPPYGLSFMGKKWDYDVPSVELWQEVLRVLKEGGYLLSFSGTRTQHRMAVNIEDAGFEIRDMIAWVYGSGFPKSHNIGKAVDKLQDNEREVVGKYKHPEGGNRNCKANDTGVCYQRDGRDWEKELTKGTSEWEGWGTALKPALEPITMARKPFKGTVANNVLTNGVGGINIDGCRIEGKPESPGSTPPTEMKGFGGFKERSEDDNTKGRFPANFIHDGSDEVTDLFPYTKSGGGIKANKKTEWGFENNKPLSNSKTNYNIDKGSASRFFYCAKASKQDRNEGLKDFEEKGNPDNYIMPKLTCSICGSKRINEKNKLVCRCNGKTHYEKQNSEKSKNNLSGGIKNNHPTVKPTDLMRYLVRLITPKKGIVLDCFMGSGSTGKACALEGFNFVGIDLDKDYCEIAKARIDKAIEDKRIMESQMKLF